MGDIAKSVLGGAWTLLVGWVLPTGLNLAAGFFLVAPSLRHTGPVEDLWPSGKADTTLLLLAAAALLGVALNAVQTPLYRVLHGYILWPARLYNRGCARAGAERRLIEARLRLVVLERRKRRHGGLPAGEEAELAALYADPRVARHAPRDLRRSDPQIAQLREQLDRYPVDPQQLLPTRLGNAVRRFEEYGYDRYRLDSKTFWNELTGTVPDQIRRQEELARASVDFFVALLYGHAALAVVAVGTALAAGHPDLAPLTAVAVLASALIPLWYRAAVQATDGWAEAVRALVNIGRRPLAEALGLELPATLAEERTMWSYAGLLAQLPYEDGAAALDRFRAGAAGTGGEPRVSAPAPPLPVPPSRAGRPPRRRPPPPRRRR